MEINATMILSQYHSRNTVKKEFLYPNKFLTHIKIMRWRYKRLCVSFANHLLNHIKTNRNDFSPAYCITNSHCDELPQLKDRHPTPIQQTVSDTFIII